MRGSPRTRPRGQCLSNPSTSQVTPHARTVGPEGTARSAASADLYAWQQRLRQKGRCLDGGPRAGAPIPVMPSNARRLIIALLMAGACACAGAPVPASRDADALEDPWGEDSRPAPAAARVERAVLTGLRLAVMPDQAHVYVDGRAMGIARQLGALLPLAPGVHQVSVQLEGHDTWRAEVRVGDRPEPIEVTLTASP
ncbi:PEGA domain-containing protein [Corallococcus sp. AB049A]|nr:PEGA domain-containing protein [Corallococcus sp. AB049A]